MLTEPYSTIATRSGDVRVLTLNLWQQYGAWPDRRSLLIEGLRALQPDIVAFQESIKTTSMTRFMIFLVRGFT
ncbi:endonuclease/exonuclease/phosphatase family protein [Edaphobacter albus]|uniref:endonuclease/exonuclease/phosphatase family protein n=1 Tax=Edaphobacter sp. 4G125 TaxID=2763071 RepID=UPI0016463DAB|nr:hypothetical protein [Edaphobacter sp. 4G125]QNI36022.1 hypothetical protein H7846_13580 [Edaphobacter sp. 4G125]